MSNKDIDLTKGIIYYERELFTAWLIKNKDSLSIRGIERQLKMPDSTLIKAVNGSQKLPKKWVRPLTNFINNLVKL